jgi:hypothetical protein
MKTLSHRALLLAAALLVIPIFASAAAADKFQLQMQISTHHNKLYHMKPTVQQTQATTQITLANARFISEGQIDGNNQCMMTRSLSPSGKTLKITVQGVVQHEDGKYLLSFEGCNALVNNLQVEPLKSNDKIIRGIMRHSPFVGVSKWSSKTDELQLEHNQSMQVFNYALAT